MLKDVKAIKEVVLNGNDLTMKTMFSPSSAEKLTGQRWDWKSPVKRPMASRRWSLPKKYSPTLS